MYNLFLEEIIDFNAHSQTIKSCSFQKSYTVNAEQKKDTKQLQKYLDVLIYKKKSLKSPGHSVSILINVFWYQGFKLNELRTIFNKLGNKEIRITCEVLKQD